VPEKHSRQARSPRAMQFQRDMSGSPILPRPRQRESMIRDAALRFRSSSFPRKKKRKEKRERPENPILIELCTRSFARCASGLFKINALSKMKYFPFLHEQFAVVYLARTYSITSSCITWYRFYLDEEEREKKI